MYLNGIETVRLSFRNLGMTDVKTWEKFFEINLSLEYLGLDLSLENKAQSLDWIERQLTRYKEKRYGHHALIEKHMGKFIGQCGLLKQEIEEKEEIELGYHILPEFWGKGYATEAALKVKDYAVEKKHFNSLISLIDVRNIRSQKVAEKLGMKIDKEMQLFGLDVFIYRIALINDQNKLNNE